MCVIRSSHVQSVKHGMGPERKQPNRAGSVGRINSKEEMGVLGINRLGAGVIKAAVVNFSMTHPGLQLLPS